MPVGISTLLYLPNYDMWSVPIIVHPFASQPGGSAYSARGIFNTTESDVIGIDGSIFSDQRTILDVREAEFSVVPIQGDHIVIPVDCNGKPLGEFEVLDADTNGGGETTLALRKIVPAAP